MAVSCLAESRPDSRCISILEIWRKVRAPVDKVPGNAWGARAHGKCNREQTAEVPGGYVRLGLARVKGCGKSAPRRWQHSTARQTPPGARPNRESGAHLQGWGADVGPASFPGRLLEGRGDAAPRGMIASDRTRLTGQLPLFLALNPKCRNPKEFFCETRPTFANARKSL